MKVKIRFATLTGQWHWREAEILSEYTAIQSVHVRMLDTGACCYVHPSSIEGMK